MGQTFAKVAGGGKAEISTKFAVARMRALARCPRAAQGGNFFLDAWSRTLTHPCKPGMEVENDIFIDRLVDELIDKVCIRILKSFSGRLEHDSFPSFRVLECTACLRSEALWVSLGKQELLRILRISCGLAELRYSCAKETKESCGSAQQKSGQGSLAHPKTEQGRRSRPACL